MAAVQPEEPSSLINCVLLGEAVRGTTKMKRFRVLICLLCFTMTMPTVPVSAQVECGVPVSCQEYRLICQTVYEQQPTTTYRLQQETVMHQRQVTSYRPVTETTTRERRYQVAKPVTETAYREERKTVLRPVWETKYKDMSYNRVRYVNETSSRTERRVVQKPVTETSYREERRVVQKPVTQTVMQDQTTTAMVPVTQYKQQLVDRGQYVDQYAFKPGDVRNRLRWQPRGCSPDPVTGACQFQRAGLYWQQQQQQGSWTANKVYVPKMGIQQIAETQYQPQTYARKIAIPVTSYVPEVQARKVPIQTVRMVQEEQFRQVPVTTQKPVVERVTNYVPERVCKWVPQQMVRRVPVTTQRVVYEDRVEQVPITTTRMVAEYKTVEVPQTTNRWIPETTMRQVPRTVMMKVPVESGYTTVNDFSYTSPITESYAQPYAEPIRLAPTVTESYSLPIVESGQPTTPIPSQVELLETPQPASATQPIIGGDGWRNRVPQLEPSARRPDRGTQAARDGVWRSVAKKDSTDNIRLSSND